MEIPSLLTTTEAAQRLRVSSSCLAKLRVRGGGPRFVKIGARVGYNPEDLAAWMAGKTHGSTSEYQVAKA